jgi:thymidine phosphorylase
LAPADGRLYALRDATGTVASIPLIAASVLSKKIASGAEAVVLDVKAGSGAFMRFPKDAFELARCMGAIGKLAGLDLRATVTDMDQPLGRAIGNALEVAETAEAISGRGGTRLMELCLHVAGLALEVAGQEPENARRAVASGAALDKARQWFEAQGADPAVLDDPAKHLPKAPVIQVVVAQEAGWVQRWDAGAVGRLVVDLGGGRKRKEDAVDPAVGVESLVEVGDRIERGQPFARAHAQTAEDAEMGIEILRQALTVGAEASSKPRLVLESPAV